VQFGQANSDALFKTKENGGRLDFSKWVTDTKNAMESLNLEELQARVDKRKQFEDSGWDTRQRSFLQNTLKFLRKHLSSTGVVRIDEKTGKESFHLGALVSKALPGVVGGSGAGLREVFDLRNNQWFTKAAITLGAANVAVSLGAWEQASMYLGW